MSTCPPHSDQLDIVHVGVGEAVVARHPQILVTSALGSCVGVALWDPLTQVGGLAHVMLPAKTENGDAGPKTRFADVAVRVMLQQLSQIGTPSRRVVAKIAGGASMFRNDPAVTSVGERNILAVREELAGLRVPIRGEDVGGTHARTVELHLDSGTLVVRSYAFGMREL